MSPDTKTVITRSPFSAAGQRTLGSLPGWLIVVGICLTFLQFVLIGKAVTGGKAVGGGKVEITYLISGDRLTGDVDFTTPSGSEGREAVTLPFKVTYRFDQGESVDVRVQNRYQNGAGNVTCTILTKGVVVKQSTSFGKYAIASCSGTAGEDKPLPGATVPSVMAPTQGAGLLKDEIRLTNVVRVKRYRGTGSPVVGRVTDRNAHLSYAELGGAWNASRQTDPELDGYSRQQSFDTEPKWQANISSGIVDSDLMDRYKGRNRLRDLTSAVQDDEQAGSYGDGAVKGRDVASQPIKVSGRPGWVIVREMHFDEAGVKAKMDLSAVVVVDTGRPRPSLLWIAIPETKKDLWPDINTVIGSLLVS